MEKKFLSCLINSLFGLLLFTALKLLSTVPVRTQFHIFMQLIFLAHRRGSGSRSFRGSDLAQPAKQPGRLEALAQSASSLDVWRLRNCLQRQHGRLETLHFCQSQERICDQRFIASTSCRVRRGSATRDLSLVDWTSRIWPLRLHPFPGGDL